MIIGITGGISSGKSVVSDYLISKGYKVVDSDLLVHEAYQNIKIQDEIKKDFKIDAIDRKELGKLVFSDETLRKKLESIIHPYVLKRIEEEKKNIDKVLFIVMPLLYEIGYEKNVDKVLVVNVNKVTQELRLMNRDNIDRSYAKKKIASQMPLEEKVKKADYVIDNNSSIEETKLIIDNVLRSIGL